MIVNECVVFYDDVVPCRNMSEIREQNAFFSVVESAAICECENVVVYIDIIFYGSGLFPADLQLTKMTDEPVVVNIDVLVRHPVAFAAIEIDPCVRVPGHFCRLVLYDGITEDVCVLCLTDAHVGFFTVYYLVVFYDDVCASGHGENLTHIS